MRRIIKRTNEVETVVTTDDINLGNSSTCYGFKSGVDKGIIITTEFVGHFTRSTKRKFELLVGDCISRKNSYDTLKDKEFTIIELFEMLIEKRFVIYEFNNSREMFKWLAE